MIATTINNSISVNPFAVLLSLRNILASSLAAIAIPNLLSAQKRAKVSRALADTKQIVSQTQLYVNDFNTYPTGTGAAQLVLLQTSGYISKASDPFSPSSPTTQAYCYSAPAGGSVPGQTDHIFSQSVGLLVEDCTTPPTAGGANGGRVGYSNAYGAIQPASL
jgi:type II secretory pathway pseudopilin PulG